MLISRLNISASCSIVFLFFFLAHHELVFSSLKFTMDAFWNKTHTDLLQQVSLLETQCCSSLGGNVPFLCLCHTSGSCLPDRMTIGHNNLFRNMFYLNISYYVRIHRTYFSCSITGQAALSHQVFPLGHCSFISKQVDSQRPAALLAGVRSFWTDFK